MYLETTYEIVSRSTSTSFFTPKHILVFWKLRELNRWCLLNYGDLNLNVVIRHLFIQWDLLKTIHNRVLEEMLSFNVWLYYILFITIKFNFKLSFYWFLYNWTIILQPKLEVIWGHNLKFTCTIILDKILPLTDLRWK